MQLQGQSGLHFELGLSICLLDSVSSGSVQEGCRPGLHGPSSLTLWYSGFLSPVRASGSDELWQITMLSPAGRNKSRPGRWWVGTQGVLTTNSDTATETLVLKGCSSTRTSTFWLLSARSQMVEGLTFKKVECIDASLVTTYKPSLGSEPSPACWPLPASFCCPEVQGSVPPLS